jgi:hypothetical protein
MKIYFTDNPFVFQEINKHKTKKAFLTYQLYDWSIKKIEKENGFNFKTTRKIKKKIFRDETKKYSTIVAVLDPANYRFINDLLYFSEELGLKLEIYTWDDFILNNFLMKNNLNTEDNVIVNNAIMEFEKYLKRGFLTSLFFEDLTILNFQRIEQFILILSINLLNKENKDEKCLIPEELTYDNNFKNLLKINENLFSYIYKFSIFFKKPTFKIIEQLIYNARKGNIYPPFLENKITFLKKTSKIHNYFKLLVKENFTCEISNKNISTNIFNLISLPYFIHINTSIPYIDIYKMLVFLEKNKFIISEIDDKTNIPYYKMSPEYVFDDNIIEKHSRNFLNIENWSNFYEDENYRERPGKYFNSIFQGKKIEFICPVCGYNKFKENLEYYKCANPKCNFRFYKIINPGGIPIKIIERDFKKLIKYKKTLIKNKIGGYNMYKLERIYKNTFAAKPIIH